MRRLNWLMDDWNGCMQLVRAFSVSRKTITPKLLSLQPHGELVESHILWRWSKLVAG